MNFKDLIEVRNQIIDIVGKKNAQNLWHSVFVDFNEVVIMRNYSYYETANNIKRTFMDLGFNAELRECSVFSGAPITYNVIINTK